MELARSPSSIEAIKAARKAVQKNQTISVVVIANFSNDLQSDSIVGFPASGEWKLRFNSDWHGYSELFECHPSGDVAAVAINRDTLPFQASVSLAPYSALIYSQ